MRQNSRLGDTDRAGPCGKPRAGARFASEPQRYADLCNRRRLRGDPYGHPEIVARY